MRRSLPPQASQLAISNGYSLLTSHSLLITHYSLLITHYSLLIMPIPDQYKGSGYGTIYSDAELRQAIADTEVNNLIGEGGGGSTDPTNPNAVELSDGTDFYKALSEGEPADGVAGPTGGSGALKWLSGIWSLANSIKALLPSALVGDRFKVNLPTGQQLAADSSPVVLPALQLSAIASETTLAKLIWASTAITSASGSYTSQNGSEKTWIVPAGVEWQLTEFYADFVTTATIGNRQLSIRILDAADNAYCRLPVGVTQAASLTRRYSWGVGLPDMTSFRDTDKLQTPLPPLILPTGFKIKIIDTAAIDTTNDSLTVRGLVLQRTI
jgi:hypothetical protein